jgi:hypothetical protein
MPPEPRDARRTAVSAEERGLLTDSPVMGANARDDRRTSAGRQRILRERRQQRPPGGWRGWSWIIVAVAGAVLLVLVLWLLRTRVPATFPPPAEGIEAYRRLAIRAGALTYAAPDGRHLAVETHLLPDQPTPEERMRALIEALLEGPTTALLDPWPEGASLLDLFLSEDGTVYVNMSGSVRARLAPGDYTEWLLLASLTCTLCENFPAVSGVRLLIDGESQGPLRRMMPLEWTYVPALFAEVR